MRQAKPWGDGGVLGNPIPFYHTPENVLPGLFLCGSVPPCPFLPAFPLPCYQEIPNRLPVQRPTAVIHV